MLSLQTLELCPYPCIPWNFSRVLWNIIIFISFSKHNNSGLFFYINFGFLAFILPNIGILPYPSKHCNFGLIFFNIRILTLSFQTLTFWSYPCKDYNSGPIPTSCSHSPLSLNSLARTVSARQDQQSLLPGMFTTSLGSLSLALMSTTFFLLHLTTYQASLTPPYSTLVVPIDGPCAHHEEHSLTP